VPTDSEQTLMGGDVRSGGTAILVGAAATRVRLTPQGGVEVRADQLGSDYAAVVVADDGLVLVGENGVRYE
jgi:hypothetical protein